MSRACNRPPSSTPLYGERASTPASSHAAVANNEMRRRIKHGPVRPMHEPTLIERLLRR